MTASQTSPFLSRKQHQRAYTTAAALTNTNTSTATKLARNTLTHSVGTSRVSVAASSTDRPLSTRRLMPRLDKALQDQDLKTALDLYLILRRRSLPPDYLQPWFRFQRKLVQLFHKIRLQSLASDQVHRLSLQLEQRDFHRKRVLRHIVQRTLKGHEHAESLAGLVDAIGKSKAMVQHSYITKSSTKLQDWRDALKVLEDWAESPASWKRLSSRDTILRTSELDQQDPPTLPTVGGIWRNRALEHELGTWLTVLMKKLVYTHTYLIRSMLDTIPQQFGIRTTAGMHLALLRYYATLGPQGCKETLAIVENMNNQDIPWKQEPAIYDYLLHSLSHMSGNEVQADKIIEQMLADDHVPREETMKAVILCAARSGDLEMCSRYIRRMHQEWGLTVTERMKAILLYACAKRGDFDSALEILGQLSHSGTLVHPKIGFRMTRTRRSPGEAESYKRRSMADMQEVLSVQDIVNNSNILLALINQTNAKRGSKRQLTHKFVKEEVSKVLELFTVITKNPDQVDTQLYTIMMQYLSTLPSPLPGMMYLYREMQVSKNAKPNNVTYRIMLEACAEQMDMEQGARLWAEMAEANIPEDCHVRASYVKGWGRLGSLKQAEQFTLEGLLAQEALDKERLRYQRTIAARDCSKRNKGLLGALGSSRTLKQPPTNEMISLTVLHELMWANRAHNRPERVLELYQEIEKGRWGRGIRPNQFSLSIVLQACGSVSASVELVDQGIDLVEHYLDQQRRGYRQQQEKQQQQRFDGGDDDGPHFDDIGGNEGVSKGQLEKLAVFLMENETTMLSDINYQLYFTMLGCHHRQRKMVTVWDDMMESIERPPSRKVVHLVTEALENVQWGAAPIKRIQKQLRERWPNVDWAGSRSSGLGANRFDEGGEDKIGDDPSVGAGGRFWK
ncbi:hypothetical protein BGX28_007571 [Mortierella sp. GBA30]|nr:hypothetical protein BGX28_007571 [Mortierella sp. GBA30]